jgi:hypothetical protein
MQIVRTYHAVGGRPHFLDRREEQPNQNSNDGDDHEELDKCESPARMHNKDS